ncbi:MAG: AAA family ATPase [Aerococcus sp.]|nr:AAA family ATPase [Aerococcus sp.]
MSRPLNLQVKLFGIPSVKQNNKTITFPYAKVDALLYYLFVNKEISRSEIAGMLWPNKDDTKSKKNLRNSIYQANKTLGGEYILTPNRYNLKLNPDLAITVDVWEFTEDPKGHLTHYQDEFLKGFFLKDADDYESWLLDMRTYYEQLYTNQLRDQIEASMANDPNPSVEQHIQSLIEIDEYNEENYRLLMTYYQQMGLNSKVIETYYRVNDLFKRELNIAPSSTLTALYKQTISHLQTKSSLTSVIPKYYYVRSTQIATFEQTLDQFLDTHVSDRLLIMGESGSGKTTFIHQVLSTSYSQCHVVYLYANEYLPTLAGQIWQQLIGQLLLTRAGNLKQAEKQEWHTLLTTQLEDWLRDQELRQERFQSLNQLYHTLYGDAPFVFVLEHLENVDDLSLKLLNALILSQQLPLLVILSGNHSWTPFLQTEGPCFEEQQQLQTITLPPLSEEEAQDFLSDRLNQPLSPAVIADILSYAQGNLLVLETLAKQAEQHQSLNYLPPRITDMIEEQCHFLSEMGNAILEMISFFNEGVTLDILTMLMKESTTRIKQEVDSLYQKQIIVESILDDALTIRIKHRRVRHYFYMRQPESLRRLMHQTIADTLAQSPDNDTEHLALLQVIAHHYNQAHQTVNALDYELAYLQNILRFEHELFPVYQQANHSHQKPAARYSDAMIQAKFQELRDKLTEIRHHDVTNNHFMQLEIKFLYIEGRYHIRNGEYTKGVADIAQVIAQAKGSGENSYLLRGYLQMIYYYIQVDEPLPMKQYVDLALELAVEANNYQYTSIVLRLQGLQFLMTGQLNQAEESLQSSIKMLTLTDYMKQHFMVSLAAAYDYLAEVAFIRNHYEEAYDIETQALHYLEQQQATSSQLVLSTNMGRILFALKRYEEAEESLSVAKALIKQTTSLWKRGQVFAYLAVTQAKRGNLIEAKLSLHSCQLECEQQPNHSNEGIYHWACAHLLYEASKQSQVNMSVPSSALSDEIALAKKYLNPYREAFEIAQLSDLI